MPPSPLSTAPSSYGAIDIGAHRKWLGLALTGARSNRDAIGAKVRLSAGGRIRHAHVSPYGGYLGTNTKTLYFGLATLDKADWVEITWPSGALQRLENLSAGRVHPVTEPRDAAAPGRAVAPPRDGPKPSPKP